jgi:hypothetical protein
VTPGLVSVGYLHPGDVSHCFMQSLRDVLMHDVTSDEPRIVTHRFGEMSKQCGAAGIADGRNFLVKTFLDESEAEWLWMVDADMGFAANTVERLVAAADPLERPVVGGLAFACKSDGMGPFGAGRFRPQPTLYDFVETGDKVGFLARMDYERDALVKVAGTGGACLLMHRSALELLRGRFGDVWFDPIRHPSGTVFSEDLSFCVRLAACDVPLFVDTRVKTTHDKGAVFFDEDTFDMFERSRARP